MAILFAPPRFKATDKSNAPISGAFLQFFQFQTSTPQPIYTDSTLQVPLQNATKADANGLFPEIWLDDSLPPYKVVLSSPDTNNPTLPGAIIWSIQKYNSTFDAATFVDTLFPFIYPQTHAELTAGVTPTNYAYAPDPVADARRYCNLVLDASTDNTSAVSGMWTALANYRGTITIPCGCKFNKSTVYSMMPVGVVLLDESSVNTGQPPGYKNKSIIYYTNDTVSDDAQHGINSAHHPSLRFNNLHTAGTGSASSRFHSILFAAGYRWTNDPIDGMQYLTSLSTRIAPPNYLWRNSWVLNTKAQAAVLSVHWTATTVFANGAVIDTTDGNVWINNGGSGTSASTEPTGTGPTFVDGTVTWTWLYPWNVASTLFFFDEDGYGGIAGATARWGADGVMRKGPSLNVNDSTHDSFIRDDQRAQDFWRITDAAGLRHGGIQSLPYSGAISGATPTLSGSMHTVNNGGATNMTNLVLPGSQTSGYVVLLFTNGNTTVKASGFNLKGNIDVTPVANNIMTFFKEPSISGSWIEISRNF